MIVQPALCRTWSEIPKTGFLTTKLIFGVVKVVFLKYFQIASSGHPLGEKLLPQFTRMIYFDLCGASCQFHILIISHFGFEVHDFVSG